MDGQGFNNDPYNQMPPVQNYGEPVKPKTPALAIVSLVMGILSLLLGCCYGIGLIFAIAGLIMAIIANKQSKSGVGIAGLICSIIGCVYGVIMVAYYVFIIAAMTSSGIFSELLNNPDIASDPGALQKMLEQMYDL